MRLRPGKIVMISTPATAECAAILRHVMSVRLANEDTFLDPDLDAFDLSWVRLLVGVGKPGRWELLRELMRPWQLALPRVPVMAVTTGVRSQPPMVCAQFETVGDMHSLLKSADSLARRFPLGRQNVRRPRSAAVENQTRQLA